MQEELKNELRHHKLQRCLVASRSGMGRVLSPALPVSEFRTMYPAVAAEFLIFF